VKPRRSEWDTSGAQLLQLQRAALSSAAIHWNHDVILAVWADSSTKTQPVCALLGVPRRVSTDRRQHIYTAVVFI